MVGAIRKLSCTLQRRPASTRQAAGYPPLIIPQSNVNKEPKIESAGVFDASYDPISKC